MISAFWSVWYLYKNSLYIRLYFMWFLAKISKYVTSSLNQPTVPLMTQYLPGNAAPGGSSGSPQGWLWHAAVGSSSSVEPNTFSPWFHFHFHFFWDFHFLWKFNLSLDCFSICMVYYGVIFGCNRTKKKCSPLFRFPLYISL